MPLNKKRVLSLIMISMFIYTGCEDDHDHDDDEKVLNCLLYTSPSPRD